MTAAELPAKDSTPFLHRYFYNTRSNDIRERLFSSKLEHIKDQWVLSWMSGTLHPPGVSSCASNAVFIDASIKTENIKPNSRDYVRKASRALTSSENQIPIYGPALYRTNLVYILISICAQTSNFEAFNSKQYFIQ